MQGDNLMMGLADHLIYNPWKLITCIRYSGIYYSVQRENTYKAYAHITCN